MKPFLFLILLSILSMPAVHEVSADKVVLNSGEIIEGLIISETKSNLDVDIAGYKGISRVIPKSEVTTIRRDSAIRPKFATEVQTPTPQVAAPQKHHLVSFSGNAFDFVLLVSEKENLGLAVDPEILDELAKTKLDISGDTDLSGLKLIESTLAPHGFILQPVALTPNRKAVFLTTPAASSYLTALMNLSKGDLKLAYDVLVKAGEVGRTEYTDHCRGLKEVLRSILSCNKDIRTWDAEMRQSVQRITMARASLGTAAMARLGGDGSPQSTAAGEELRKNLEKQMHDEANNVSVALAGLVDAIAARNKSIGLRFRTTLETDLNGEANYLMDYLTASYIQLRSTVDLLISTRLAKPDLRLGDLPDEIGLMRRLLLARAHSVDQYTKDGLGLLGIADDKAARFLSRAVSLDRGSFLARAGLGYAETKHIVDSSKQVFASNTAKDVGPWVHRLESEFRAHERHGLLRALGRIRNLPINEEGLRQEGKVGSANGLAVTAREGGLFPISVRIEPVEEKRDVVEEKKLTFDYWGDVRVREYQIESLNYPISFGDYGEKDPFMFISAIEAYKWLKSLSQTMEGLKVEFHELLVGKAGDSAGVTMAVAGHSVLNHVPIRQDVAMTGSIRSDGAVKAVGGVPNKVAGAYAAAGIELVIVPKENEPDLVFVPVDQLCRLTIVVAGDIKTYLKYAIQPTLGHISDDQQEADQITKRLQEAQARLLVGEIDEAVSLLEPIRNSNREIYSARRLLELIDIQRKAHIAETQYGGTTN